MGVCSSVPTRSLSFRGKSEARDAAIHCMQWTRSNNAVRFPPHSGSPPAFSPRDDKIKGKDVGGSVTWRSLSLRGKSGARDAAINCMQ